MHDFVELVCFLSLLQEHMFYTSSKNLLSDRSATPIFTELPREEEPPMLADTPHIRTDLQAIDELDDIRQGIAGLSHIVLAMESADISSKNSLFLIARLLDYFALTMGACAKQLEAGESDGGRLQRETPSRHCRR